MAPKKQQNRNQTQSQTREKPEDLAKPAQNAGAVAAPAAEAPRGLRLRIPYVHRAKELYGIDAMMWNVLISAVWPAARTPEAIMLALAYCKGRHLDPMKKMVHIVPVWDKNAPGAKAGESGAMIETVWPSIAEIRVTASRTGSYGGKDAAIFGEDKTEEFIEVDSRTGDVKEKVSVTYPEWCRVDVYRIVQGIRCQFQGPKVYWKESYATKSRWSPIPNEMWSDRKSGQLEKCAEAASLRAAFPEELGGEYAAEEMWGKKAETDGAPLRLGAPLQDGEVRPHTPASSEFTRQEAPAAERQAEPARDDPKPKPQEEPGAGAAAGANVIDADGEEEEAAGESPSEQAAADARAALDESVKRAKDAMNQAETVGRLAMVFGELVGNFPPEGPHTKELTVFYEARQQEIKNRVKK